MNTKSKSLRRDDILYPELSYQIVGALFEVFNDLGYQYQERYYQRALKECFLKNLKISFQEQVMTPVVFQGKTIGRYFFDFLIEDKIILEIKRGDAFSPHDIKQTFAYLTHAHLQLAILARFSSKGMKYKRIVNIQ